MVVQVAVCGWDLSLDATVMALWPFERKGSASLVDSVEWFMIGGQ
jgi:hypothetical protein